jgi:hypothetical protein
MALGNLTYKTPNPINQIEEDLTSKEGCCVTLTAQATIGIAQALTDIPYGIITVGGDSLTPGTYPSQIAASAIELVDSIGGVVQALAGTGGVSANMFVALQAGGGGELQDASLSATSGDYIWGLALTDAAAGEQFLFRFQPSVIP